MRCSKCLSEMAARDGTYVCRSCGERAEFFNDDGSKAEFERLRPAQRPGPATLIAALLALAALAGGAYAAINSDLLKSFRAPAEQAPPPQVVPDIRTDVAARFDPSVRANIIASFGTPGDDTAEGLAVFADARIATLVRGGGGDPALHLVTIDGTETLTSRRLDVSGSLHAASLMTGPEGLAALMLADDDGLQVLGLAPGGERVWGRSWQGLDLSEGSAAAASDTDALVVVASGSLPGTRLAALLDGSGGLVWQRTFPAGGGEGALAAKLADTIWLAWPATSGAGTALTRLSPAGEVVIERALDEAPDRIAGLQAMSDGSLRILLKGAPPEVIALGPLGDELWRAGISGAMLSDRMVLVAGPADGVFVVSSYRLSDVQTDLSVTSLSAGGDIHAGDVMRLPAGAVIGGALAGGRGQLLLVAAVPEADEGPRDAVLVIADGATAPRLAEQPAQSRLPVAEAAGPAPALPEQAAPEPVDTPASIDCDFTCRTSEGQVIISQKIFEADAGEPTDLRAIQALICQAAGGAAEPGTAPVCTPAPY